MAYLVALKSLCRQCKTARAVVELFDRWNGTRGVYCRKCGARALKLQTAREMDARPDERADVHPTVPDARRPHESRNASQPSALTSSNSGPRSEIDPSDAQK